MIQILSKPSRSRNACSKLRLGRSVILPTVGQDAMPGCRGAADLSVYTVRMKPMGLSVIVLFRISSPVLE